MSGILGINTFNISDNGKDDAIFNLAFQDIRGNAIIMITCNTSQEGIYAYSFGGKVSKLVPIVEDKARVVSFYENWVGGFPQLAIKKTNIWCFVTVISDNTVIKSLITDVTAYNQVTI